MTRYAFVGLAFAAALFIAASFAQTGPNRPPAKQPPPQQKMQWTPPVAPPPQPQSGLANRADPLIPVIVVWEGGHFDRALPPEAYMGQVGVQGDRDGDGGAELDCDDNDPTRTPGAPEVADFEGHDEDCDYSTIGRRDADGDGFTSWSATQLVRDRSGAVVAVLRGPDCDDLRRDVNPNASEVLGDRRDNNCDGLVDIIEDTGHNDYCKLTREVRRSVAARQPCGR